MDRLNIAFEFSALTGVFAVVFIMGLVKGRTLMKAPLSASRDAEPVKYWTGQAFFGLGLVVCLYAALSLMPSHIWIQIVRR